jgi:hypothetical protein
MTNQIVSEWSDKAVSLNYNESAIIAAIIKLYNADQPFAVDATYSTGRMWTKLPQPLMRFDLYPQGDDVQQADARALPLADSSVGSVMFDPPFVMKDTTTRVPNGIIECRFTGYKNAADLWGMYGAALTEFYRVLTPGGIVAFKCQDVVSSGKQWWSHIKVYEMATALGFVGRDLFVLGRKSVMWSPNMRNQKHARKNHCYYWVFEKRG